MYAILIHDSWYESYINSVSKIVILKEDIRGLSKMFADTANKTLIVYHRLMKFCINKYRLSDTLYAHYDRMFPTIDWFIGH